MLKRVSSHIIYMPQLFIAICHVVTLLRSYIRDLGLAFAGTDMAQLICGGCRTLLMYARGATSVRCSCCHTVNLAPGMKKLIVDFGFGKDIWIFECDRAPYICLSFVFFR